MDPYLRIIGDVHGHYDRYVQLARKAEYSIQLGDLGFKYDCLNALDSAKHKVLAGNHDNYSLDESGKFKLMNTQHWLGDWGTYRIPELSPIFFMRGGFSIDWKYRVEGRDWWRDEELSYAEMQKAIEFYDFIRPDIVITHECPTSICGVTGWVNSLNFIPEGTPSRTAQCLERMFCIYQPDIWLFGHHHKRMNINIERTQFVCLEELGILDIEKGRK